MRKGRAGVVVKVEGVVQTETSDERSGASGVEDLNIELTDPCLI
jgi:hypothetical protein